MILLATQSTTKQGRPKARGFTHLLQELATHTPTGTGNERACARQYGRDWCAGLEAGLLLLRRHLRHHHFQAVLLLHGANAHRSAATTEYLIFHLKDRPLASSHQRPSPRRRREAEGAAVRVGTYRYVATWSSQRGYKAHRPSPAHHRRAGGYRPVHTCSCSRVQAALVQTAVRVRHATPGQHEPTCPRDEPIKITLKIRHFCVKSEKASHPDGHPFALTRRPRPPLGTAARS
jgi:hypothetical protein